MPCTTHNNHAHKHSATCGHKGIRHEDHIDYLHDDHLHHMHDDHVDEHTLSHDKSSCTPDHNCAIHDKGHKHGLGCGHDAIPHGNHVDYLVGEHLHHPCQDHCDHHGAITIA